MAVTITKYSHTAALFFNGSVVPVNFSNIRVQLLNNSATFNAAHTAKSQVDSGSSATITVTIASPGVVTDTAHGFSADQAVMFRTSGALPTGLVANTYYYVLAAGLTTNTYQLATTPGGTAIVTSGSQSGTHTRYSAGAYEVYGHNWPVGGFTLANVNVSQVAIDDATVNDATFDADDVDQVADGTGSIGPAYKALLYDATTLKPLAFIDFGQAQTAGATTSFKFRWPTGGIFPMLSA